MITYKMHHVNGLYFEITGDEGKNREYDVVFLDKDTMKSIYESKMKVEKLQLSLKQTREELEKLNLEIGGLEN